ncbi:MAG TPA: DUF4910 domain-containing protein, partial [Alphaproteobacteria bacterium]|nr:DUF4910 domain-containing protein [Alphaproteobacteria bacterium]
HNQLKTLKPGKYHAVVDSDLKPGVLNYAELILPGKSEKEILLSTYVCHPSMANNELSGPVVTTALAQYLMAKKDRRYTYRIIFVPETIGAVVYLSKNLEAMKRNTVAGYVVTCCGDDRAYSYLESRLGNTRADHTARQVLKRMHPEYVTYPFIDCGSDERQYCSPRIDLPAASVMRTRYGIYPEYHTSLDDLSLVTPAGLEGAYDVMCNILDALENSRVYRLTNFAEPQLGKRGLYPALSTKSSVLEVQNMINLMNYADGNHDLVAIAERIGADINECAQIAEKLHKAGLLEVVD